MITEILTVLRNARSLADCTGPMERMRQLWHTLSKSEQLECERIVGEVAERLNANAA